MQSLLHAELIGRLTSATPSVAASRTLIQLNSGALKQFAHRVAAAAFQMAGAWSDVDQLPADIRGRPARVSPGSPVESGAHGKDERRRKAVGQWDSCSGPGAPGPRASVRSRGVLAGP